MSPHNDCFIETNRSIAPLTIGNSENEYSIKIVMKKCNCKDEQINIYTGKFVSDIASNTIGFQGSIMLAIENIIQEMIEPSFIIGSLPKLGKPPGFVFLPNDILISFSKRNDYFIIRGTNDSREVNFFTTGEIINIWEPNGIEQNFSFQSPTNDISYNITFTPSGIITITDNRGRDLFFDPITNPLTSPIATYKSLNLIENTNYTDGTRTYKMNSSYTDVGITILPNTLPLDQNNIMVAEGYPGFFYNEYNTTSFQDLIDYIFLQFPTFTNLQKAYIIRLIKNIFNPIRNVIHHIANVNNRDSFSINNGFATSATTGLTKIEIKIS